MGDRDFQHLEILGRISTSIRDGEAAPGLAQCAVDDLEQTLAYENGAVLLLEPDSGRLDPLALAKPGGDLERWIADFDHVRRHEPRAGQGITGWVAATGESACVDDVRSDERYTAMRDGLRSELCVPLRRGERVLGVFNVESPREGAFDDDDRRLLEIVAAELALAVEGLPPSVDAADEIVTVCSYCRRVRLDVDDWRAFEAYFTERTGMQFSHGVCGDCRRDLT